MKWGGVYWSHPVRPSVGMSVHLCLTKSCPGHNFKSIKASNFKLHDTDDTLHDTLWRRAVYKNHNSTPTIFGVIVLCKF